MTTTNDKAMSGFEKHKAKSSWSEYPYHAELFTDPDTYWSQEPAEWIANELSLAPQLLALWEAVRVLREQNIARCPVEFDVAIQALEARADEIYQETRDE